MKVNKMIYLDLEILQDMERFCKNNDMKISKLIEQMWKAYKRTYKKK